MKNPVINKRGFTLVEVLITLVITGIVIAGVYNVYIYLQKTWLAESIKAEMQQKARVAIGTMSQDMMMMGYGTGVATIDTVNYTSTDKILIADTNQLQFRAYMEKMTPAKEYVVKYYMSGTNLMREIKSSDGLEPVKISTLAENLENPDLPGVPTLAFKYYKVVNGNLQEITTTPVDPQPARNDIRRITVSMSMKSSKPMPGTNDYKTITLTADISPKNLWEGEMTIDTMNPDPPNPSTPLHVVNTGRCGLLKAKWGKATDNIAVAGYLIKYGNIATGQYTGYKSVLVSQLADPDNPEAEFSVGYSPYTGVDVSPSNYYVTVVAFDAAGNYSTNTNEAHSVSFANQTGFSQSGDCTINLVNKPGAVSSFSATGANQSVNLSWSAPTNPNVVGYRIFRSYTTFNVPDDFPIGKDDPLPSRIKQLTKETESGDGWGGSRTDLGVTSYIDSDPTLKGCTPYYYAICPVTCDRSRILGDASHTTEYGGRYTSAQYAFAYASPLDNTKPGDPQISSAAGWKRIFLNVNWPTDNDYKFTKVYFTTGASPPSFNPSDPSAADPYLIPDRQVGYTEGTFKNYGTSSEHTIIFNTTGGGTIPKTDLADEAQPQLDNGASYAFRVVAFDKCGNPSDSMTGIATTMTELCGDDPCGAPTWNTSRYVWVNGAASNLDASTWDNNAADGNTQINIGLVWTGVDTNDPATARDFFGYYVSRNITPTLSGAYALGSTEWHSYIESAGLAEGSVYYYGIRAADCLYHNIGPSDVVPAICNGVEIMENYDYVRANNITSAADTLWSGAIKPGKISKYTRTDTATLNPEYNFVATEGDYHNRVRFYLSNTSQANLQIDWMKLLWGNSAAHLKTITIGPLDDGTIYTYTPGLISNTSASQITMGATITNHATSTTMPSDKIPVLLEFVNSDNTVNEFDNMAREVITLEISFTNASMPNAANSSSGVSGFTTGVYNGFNPLKLIVSGGPNVNYVNQNKPINPTTAFEISNASSLVSLPTGFPEVNGGTAVTVTANITRPSTETINGAQLHYVYTSPSATNPGTATFNTVDATASGSDYSATIPGTTNQGVWYYVTATTAQGNFVRKPENPDSFFYYKQLTFNPCLEVPNAPTGLGGTPSSLTWTAPTQYTSGSDINFTLDPMTYNVYRRPGLTGDFLATHLIASGLVSKSYNDTGYPAYSFEPVAYAVSAVNSCSSAVNESALSDIFIVCPTGGTGCALDATPVNIYAGDPISLNVAVCSTANNGAFTETGVVRATASSGRDFDDFTVTEVSDSGTASISIPTTMNSLDNNPGRLWVIGAGQIHDTITITPKSAVSPNTFFSDGCSVTSTVNVYVYKCDNIPDDPTLSGSLQGSNLNLSWSAVTLNTDGSPVTYTAPAPLVGDSIATYEVWYSQTNTDPNTDIGNWIKIIPTSTGGSWSATTATIKMPFGTYYFTARALDQCGKGMFSNVISVTR